MPCRVSNVERWNSLWRSGIYNLDGETVKDKPELVSELNGQSSGQAFS